MSLGRLDGRHRDAATISSVCGKSWNKCALFMPSCGDFIYSTLITSEQRIAKDLSHCAVGLRFCGDRLSVLTIEIENQEHFNSGSSSLFGLSLRVFRR
jgi:hypothetical protein